MAIRLSLSSAESAGDDAHAPTGADARVALRSLRGAGYTVPEFGVSFQTSAVIDVARAIGEALVAADPLGFALESGGAGKENA